MFDFYRQALLITRPLLICFFPYVIQLRSYNLSLPFSMYKYLPDTKLLKNVCLGFHCLVRLAQKSTISCEKNHVCYPEKR